MLVMRPAALSMRRSIVFSTALSSYNPRITIWWHWLRRSILLMVSAITVVRRRVLIVIFISVRRLTAASTSRTVARTPHRTVIALAWRHFRPSVVMVVWLTPLIAPPVIATAIAAPIVATARVVVMVRSRSWIALVVAAVLWRVSTTASMVRLPWWRARVTLTVITIRMRHIFFNNALFKDIIKFLEKTQK